MSIRAAQFIKARAFSAMIFMLLGFAPALAVVRIGDDSGGQIGPYLAKYRALRASGERVEIDGACASACTMLLGIIPRNHICVTPRASLVFHSAWDPQGDQASQARTATGSCGRLIRKAFANGSNATAGCIRRSSCCADRNWRRCFRLADDLLISLSAIIHWQRIVHSQVGQL